ncbi:MAG: hypothetical protein ACYC1I_09420 [Acidimicrobiales bacterium]
MKSSRCVEALPRRRQRYHEHVRGMSGLATVIAVGSRARYRHSTNAMDGDQMNIEGRNVAQRAHSDVSALLFARSVFEQGVSRPRPDVKQRVCGVTGQSVASISSGDER